METTLHYLVAAAALRSFSANKSTKKVYRYLGNRKVKRPFDFEKAAWVFSRMPKCSGPSRMLDLGTGWAHRYSLLPALLVPDLEIYCFDVWDNRSLNALKDSIAEVPSTLQRLPALSELQVTNAQNRVAAVLRAKDFSEAYFALGIRDYQVRPGGVPDFPPDFFDAICSGDVIEHVNREALDAATHSWHRSLKPGGRFVTQVGLDDHVAHYSRSAGPKEYLRYSDSVFRHLLENDVQYVNRLTASEILETFEAHGLRVTEAIREMMDETPPVHRDYGWQTAEDVRTIRLLITAEKPDSPHPFGQSITRTMSGAHSAGSRP